MEKKRNHNILDVNKKKTYESPRVLSHQTFGFETAQSFNSGGGNLTHNGTGPAWGHDDVGPNPGRGTDGPPGQIGSGPPGSPYK